MKFVTPGIFRFLLALIVVVQHNVDFLPMGQTAVYVFFVLSGYWITKMYKEKYQSFQDSYRVFMVSRVLRLLPLYYLIFIISLFLSIFYQDLLLKPEIKDPVIVFSNLFLLGLTNAKYAELLPGWSLDIELQFYVIVPLILYFLPRINRLFFLLASIILSVGYFVIVGDSFYCLLSFFSFFVVGMYIYVWDIKANKIISYSMLVVALITCIIYIDMVVFYKFTILNNVHRDFLLLHKESFNILIAIFAIPYVTINIRMPVSNKYDKLFASMSYVIYLIHWPLIKIYSSYVGTMSSFGKITAFIVYILGSILISYIITITYDEYFEELRKKYLKKQRVLNSI